MSRRKTSVSAEDLSSLLDGELEPARLAEVMEAIARQPKLAEQLKDDRRIADLLEQLNQDVLKEPLPKRFTDLIEAHRRKQS